MIYSYTYFPSFSLSNIPFLPFLCFRPCPYNMIILGISCNVINTFKELRDVCQVAFGHRFVHSIYLILKFDFTCYIDWVLPETAFLEGPPVGLVVLSPPHVVLYMGCSKAQVLMTMGSHSWSTHCGIYMLLFCC